MLRTSGPASRASWSSDSAAFAQTTLFKGKIARDATDHTELKQWGRKSQLVLVLAPLSLSPTALFCRSPSFYLFFSPLASREQHCLLSHKQRKKNRQREREYEGCPGKWRGGCFLTLFFFSFFPPLSLILYSQTLFPPTNLAVSYELPERLYYNSNVVLYWNIPLTFNWVVYTFVT